MKTVLWVGNPQPTHVATSALTEETTLIWFYEDSRPFDQSINEASFVTIAIPASLSTLCSRGRIMDTLRQREPEAVVICLPDIHNAGEESLVERQCQYVQVWVVGFVDVAQAALGLMRSRGFGELRIIVPTSATQVTGDPVVKGCEAFVRTWVDSVSEYLEADIKVTIDALKL